MNSTITILKVIRKILINNILNFLFFIFALVFVVVLKKNIVTEPQIIFLDVGQGDAILIQQDNYQILVDGGPDDSIMYELAKFMPWFDKKIEKLVLTHPHDDHILGLLILLKKYEIKEILYSKVNDQDFVARVDARFNVVAGETIDLAFDLNKAHFFDSESELRIK